MNAVDYILSPEMSPDSVVLIDSDKEITFRHLLERSYAVSQIALQAGFHPGDRIILISENSLFWVATYLGLLRIGIVCVPLSPNTFHHHFEEIVESTSPVAGFIQKNVLKKLDVMFPRTTLRFTEEDVLEDVLNVKKIDLDIPACPADEKTLASLMFTSGSTGHPRGVMVSHKNIIANTESIIHYLGLTERDRIMVVLPFYYCFGTSLLHTHLRVGASLVLNNKFMFPDRVLKQMIETRCTGFAGVPSTYQILLRKSSFSKMSFPDLRWLLQAGGKLSSIFIDELRKMLPNTKIFIMYGQTEATARLSYLPPEVLEKKGGSIGKGIPGVTLQVLKEDGSPVKPGEIGEIVAKGDNIALGYWGDHEETAKTFRNGCLYTGDLATVDDDSFIYIVDRAKDFLKCGGYRISACEIEETIMRFPGVIEAAVIGVPDEIQGEAVRLFLVHKTSKKDIQHPLEEFCVKSFPPHLIPREIVFLDRLPKNKAGKVLKTKLRALTGIETEKNHFSFKT